MKERGLSGAGSTHANSIISDKDMMEKGRNFCDEVVSIIEAILIKIPSAFGYIANDSG